MGWTSEQRESLRRALAEFDDTRAQILCRAFIDEVRAGSDARDPAAGLDVLQLLQRKRKTTLIEDVAETLLAHAPDSTAVRHHYALALLDDDRTAAAEALLTQAVSLDTGADGELQGGLGRVHKQRYIRTGQSVGGRRENELSAAIDTYLTAFRHDSARRYYHGINAAALLVRAADDGVKVSGHEQPRAEAASIARAILDTVAAGGRRTLWECATAAEASLVLGRHEDAVVWTARYVGSDADAFEYASTLRQFQQLWRLDTATEPGLQLLPLLRNRLLQADGGALSVAPQEYTPESLRRIDTVTDTLQRRSGTTHYERVYGWDRFKTLAWLRQALDACRSVALVEDHGGNGYGTGFVLAGDRFRTGWPARVLVTNAHVVPEAVPAEDAWVSFHGLGNPGSDADVRVRPVGTALWQSPSHEFDACVLALPDRLSRLVVPLPIRRSFPALTPENQVRAYVIGHPLGQPELRLSLHDSLVVGARERYAYYRSPTEGGSSGSPVFDDHWQVIALHHGWTDLVPGGGPANEGIRLDSIIAELGGRAGPATG